MNNMWLAIKDVIRARFLKYETKNTACWRKLKIQTDEFIIRSQGLILRQSFVELNLVWLIIRLLPAGCRSVAVCACLSSLERIITSANQLWMNPQFFLEVKFLFRYSFSCAGFNYLFGHFKRECFKVKKSELWKRQWEMNNETRHVCVCV